MKRSERIREAVARGVEFSLDHDSCLHVDVDETTNKVLEQLSKISVVPGYTPVEGVDYSVAGIEEVREQLTALRTFAMSQGATDWVILITHAIVLLSFTADIVKEHNDA